MMVYDPQNYWFFGLCPSSIIPKTRGHNNSKTGSGKEGENSTQ